MAITMVTAHIQSDMSFSMKILIDLVYHTERFTVLQPILKNLKIRFKDLQWGLLYYPFTLIIMATCLVYVTKTML